MQREGIKKKEINIMTERSERRALSPLEGGERVHLFRVFRASLDINFI